MSTAEGMERAERIARYKEKRRKELAAQFGTIQSDPPGHRRKETNSSGSEGPRTTRASRLRAAAATAQENTSPSHSAKLNSVEKLPSSPSSSYDTGGSRRIERDKSSKRKSNLNRALNSEEVPSLDATDDLKSRRRRRRFFPQEVLEQTSSNDDRNKSDSLTASVLSSSPITASPSRLTPKKSELSVHMENARRGVTETAKAKSNSPREKSKADAKPTRRTAENGTRSWDHEKGARTINRKMEELTALTKETLARVERLAGKSSPRRPVKQAKPSSILKKKDEEPAESAAPVSILKRKVSQDKPDTHTPPVTFSPSVVEPTPTNRKQGILKKRRSLDESQVMRHRSCSPDKAPDSRSILKNQRRSSLEELTRTQSPETHLHGILKRKEDGDHSLNSPQGILKRRSGASSAGSAAGSPHVSIATAVILAAAGGAEMVLETVRPILKKKSLSDEHSFSENGEVPKPILKKKSSTDTDECDERPKPILKISRNSSEEAEMSRVKNEGECDVRPILKQNGPRLSFCGNDVDEEVGTRRSRRSHTICAEFTVSSDVKEKEEDRQLKKPRPLSVSELVMSFESGASSTGAIPKRSSLKRSSDRYRTQPVTSNELEASLNFVRSPPLENSSLLPKSSPICSPDHSVNSLLDFTSSLENDSNLNSFLSSLHNTSPDSGVCGKMSSDSAFQSLGDGLELDQEPLEVPTKASKVEPNRLEMQMKAIAEEAQKIKLGKGSAGVQKYRNRKNCPAERSSSSRFSTQPVTFDEVQEASRINKTSDESEDKDEADPSNLSLFERIKLFNVKVKENNPPKRDVPRRRLNRFQTQPVTSDEVETARCIPPTTYALDDESSGDRTGGERRGILKSRARCDSPSPRPALRRRDSFDAARRSILKTEVVDVTHDEGISCNDSASDSETAKSPDIKIGPQKTLSKFGSETTSDGDSSGGREIRSIFRNENNLKVKQALESVLSKSKSQSSFGDESESVVNRRGASIRRSQTQSAMPRAIEEIQAKLQQSGESGWRRRVHNNSNDELKLLNRYNDELSEKSILEIKKDELDAASKQWKSRVEKSDAEKFSVAGRMEKNNDVVNLSINIPSVDKNKRTPQAKRFKGKEGTDSSSTPVSPDKHRYIELTRSYSVPDPDQDSSGSDTSLRASGRKVSVNRPDDFTFKNFYKSIEDKLTTTEQIDVSLDDFDLVTRQSLLVQKKNVQVQRRRAGASKNPIKALASRTDIADEYTEVITGVAEREKKRLNIEKLAKTSSMAPAALAGLISKEDFTSVALKKSTGPTTLVPYKDVMLLHIKGRQHVQTRLVEPTATSINEGDNYVLVTPNTLYHYVGKYSNVIEQSRAADIVNHIQQSGDLGCKAAEVVTIDARSATPTSGGHRRKFFETLGGDAFTGGGHPDEDGVYETNILATNMIYRLEENELVPYEEYWGSMPKIEMLEPTKVIVFDFGTEMYIWSGKNAPPDKKKLAFRLAKEMWADGYDYTECSVCPLNVASILGNRPPVEVSKKGGTRPEWALFAKITQHRETILFKEKFLDWPDFSRIIRVKGDQNGKSVDPSYNIGPCDVGEAKNNVGPDLVLDNLHLGRGDSYFDEETNRLFEFDTLKISAWRISENHPEPLDDGSVGHFYTSDSYIVKWNYRTTVKGRELSGRPSKHLQTGRDRCVYFCWQGSNASINEKGSAALLTVELDSEKAPQIRVVEGLEPAAFLRLFRGEMVVHRRDEREGSRLFMVRGEVEEEACLVEVACETGSLRSRTSFLLVEGGTITLWHGAKSTEQVRRVAKRVAERLAERKPEEFGLDEEVEVVEMREGEEGEEFFDAVPGERGEYFSLLDKEGEYDFTPRLFCLSSVSGTFKATEMLCPHRSEHSSPFPFLQNELYSASQPALFLIDNHHELWLWQGWWPEREEETELSDQTGSGAVRWQAERKAAMQTAVNYWRKHHGDERVPAFSVWAGLEPLEFKNLFPFWVDREDVAELNAKEGKKANAKSSVEQELALLLRTTYPLAELLQRPLPEGVDPTHLEIYLSPEDFQKLLSMTKEDFQKLPLWKQTAMKKEKGLF